MFGYVLGITCQSLPFNQS